MIAQDLRNLSIALLSVSSRNQRLETVIDNSALFREHFEEFRPLAAQIGPYCRHP